MRKGRKMKSIFCALLTLLLSFPVIAKLNAYQEARINAMLDALAQKTDLIFVRNGDAHTCDEAVAHLRLKLSNTRNRIDTAEQFIDKVASSSSVTGKPYIVRIPGKNDQQARPYLHTLIAQTDKTVTVAER
ncbi:YfeK family protein [Klebsiella quasivariicola]|nr:YfeK family protein [Klebsiella quasivariicola]MBZ9582203.1 YfeK family protein [Klebsiella quasivariicola]